MTPLLELRDVTASFPGVVANDHVSLSVERGEVHGLLGENGAGKTTLARVVVGIERPDSGEILIDGRPLTIRSPRDARAAGIAMVHQHFSLCPGLTVAENLLLSEQRAGIKRLALRDVDERVRAVTAEYGWEVPSQRRVADLSVGERQRVEIVRCLLGRPRILVLDEPTAVLGPGEIHRLLGLVERLAATGCAIILITHKLEELVSATRRITVLRDGRVVGTVDTGAVTAQTLARLMIGREVSLRTSALSLEAAAAGGPASRTTGPEVLRLEGISVRGRTGREQLDDVTLAVHAGEILGVAGIEGNGQNALADVVSGMLTPAAGRVVLGGADVTGSGPAGRLRRGLAVIPQDRQLRGCVLQMSVAENLHFRAATARAPWRGLLRRRLLAARARTLIEEYHISGAWPGAPLATLSGGNQQRVVLARELSDSPRVILAWQPTRGIDVGGIEYIARRLELARDAGTGILLISNELEEILSLSDRLVIMHRGCIVGEGVKGSIDLEEIGRLMVGAA